MRLYDTNAKRDWEVCKRANVENRWTSFYMSLNTLGDLVMNRVAFRVLNEPEAVQLLYDHTSQSIGIKPVSSDSEHAFPVRPRGNRGGYRIRANRLLREFGIQIDQTLVFSNAGRDRNGITILDLQAGELLKANW